MSQGRRYSTSSNSSDEDFIIIDNELSPKTPASEEEPSANPQPTGNIAINASIDSPLAATSEIESNPSSKAPTSVPQDNSIVSEEEPSANPQQTGNIATNASIDFPLTVISEIGSEPSPKAPTSVLQDNSIASEEEPSSNPQQTATPEITSEPPHSFVITIAPPAANNASSIVDPNVIAAALNNLPPDETKETSPTVDEATMKNHLLASKACCPPVTSCVSSCFTGIKQACQASGRKISKTLKSLVSCCNIDSNQHTARKIR